MRVDAVPSFSWRRAIALIIVAGLGLVGIVGSGGGGASIDAPECSFFSNVCNPPVGPRAQVFVAPFRTTAQVGTSASFTATTDAVNPTYQWQRSTDGGFNYVNIPGATSATLTLPPVRLTDDGTYFSVDVTSPNTLVYPAPAVRLAVSSMPSVVLQDAEFLPANWTSLIVVNPAQNGPTDLEEHVATGGNPDAFRRMTSTLTAGASSMRVLNTSQAASYDPQSQGAIYTIDFTEDCTVISSSPAITLVNSKMTIQQSGRIYAAGPTAACSAPGWIHVGSWPSLGVADFVLINGPACGAGESCPDFSATAAPLKFGYVRDVSQAASAPVGTIVHGIDNWTVNVWRR